MGSGESDDPSEEAISWMIVLRDAPGDRALEARFRAWLDADPVHGHAWAELCHVDDRIEKIDPAFAVRTGVPPLRARLIEATTNQTGRATRRRRAHRPAMAFALAAVACLAVVLAPEALLRLRSDYRTGVADVQRVTLADGSVVHLAPQSSISVDYKAGRRDVTLLRGEAFFSVTRNPSRPFRVIGERTTVTVLGTAFDVREADGRGRSTFVGVEHGRVQVDSFNGRRALLGGGQAAVADASGALSRRTIPTAQAAAWRERLLIAQDEPVTDVIARLRPWFGGVIVTRGSALPRQRLTGVFNATDPVEALRGIARAYGGRVTVIGDWLIVYSQD